MPRSRSTISSTLRSCGRVTWTNSCTPEAPPTRAASYSSGAVGRGQPNAAPEVGVGQELRVVAQAHPGGGEAQRVLREEAQPEVVADGEDGERQDEDGSGEQQPHADPCFAPAPRGAAERALQG